MGERANIGKAAALSGVSTKMIRHYEAVGLLPAAARTLSGYRTYSEQEIHILKFIRHARSLGFSIKQIGDLVSLWRDQSRPSSKVKQIALAHIAKLEQKITEMQQMKTELIRLADCCHGNDRPDCPILEGLASPLPG